jgi:uncharacterized protein
LGAFAGWPLLRARGPTERAIWAWWRVTIAPSSRMTLRSNLVGVRARNHPLSKGAQPPSSRGDAKLSCMHPKPSPSRRQHTVTAPAQPPAESAADHDDVLFAQLQDLLGTLPAALDAGALDGYLCGVLLQPRTVPEHDWLPHVADPEQQGLPPQAPLDELRDLVLRRHAHLRQAIDARQWFDPWLPVPEDDADAVSDCVLPWVAGFALATDLFPALTDRKDPALNEPLALLYLHLDPEDLEDADALLAQIEAMEPPANLAEAAEDLVRAVLLLADVSQSLQRPARGGGRR